MEIYLDSTDPAEISEMEEIGYIDGVLTNPSTVAEAEKDPVELIEEICEVTEGPVGYEVVSEEAEGMIEEAKKMVEIAPNVEIKIPMGEEGLKAVKAMKEEGIRTLMTVIFSANQGLLAAKVGADYVVPFVGRLDNSGQCGIDLVEDLTRIFEIYDYETKVLVASVKHPLHVIESALVGASAIAVPFDVLKQMTEHPLTTAGIEGFSEDWENLQGKLK